MSIYVFLKVALALTLPPASLAVGVVAWLVLRLANFRRVATAVVSLAIVQTLVLSFPQTASTLIGILENRARRIIGSPPTCCFDAIVVLGGSIAPAVPPHSEEPDLSEAADRVWYAARFYKAGIAPRIIVSGGSFVEQQGGAATTEAEAMRRFLVDLGVPDEAIVPEGRSLNTIDNIRNVRAIAKGSRVLIITSAYHVPRAAKLAQMGKLNFAMYGTDWQLPSSGAPWWDIWFPAVGALGLSNAALKELIALTFDWRGESLAE